jgi:hypothetical protein
MGSKQHHPKIDGEEGSMPASHGEVCQTSTQGKEQGGDPTSELGEPSNDEPATPPSVLPSSPARHDANEPEDMEKDKSSTTMSSTSPPPRAENRNETGHTASWSGFQTGSGKPVVVPPEALRIADQYLQPCEKVGNLCVCACACPSIRARARVCLYLRLWDTLPFLASITRPKP